MREKTLNRRINSIYRRYPPRLWIFFPLYRFLRRKAQWSMGLCNMATWTVSAILHSAIVTAFGYLAAAALFGAVFLILGVVSTVVIVLVKRPYTRSI